MVRSTKHAASDGRVRIIAGQWRGRKLTFPALPGLRPTPDRVRETLFNWLAPDIVDARCLDLFTGSGALGLEALSRQAAYCDFVDVAPQVSHQIRQHLETLAANDKAQCHISEAHAFIERADEPYDIVFLDPPFDLEVISDTADRLNARGLVKVGSLIHVECGAGKSPPELPTNWTLVRDKRAGAVSFRLYRVES